MTQTAATATVHCQRCGRVLRSETSRRLGYGPTCLRRIQAAIQTSDAPAAQLDKAVELIADGGIARVTGSLYLAVSSDGSTRYEVDAATGQCSCKAGQHGRRCFHVAALSFLLGQPVTAPVATVDPSVELAVAADPFAAFDTAA